ncbi:hypothetical protein DPMN_143740 [Dreissena polymorpha]|uniref:Uncharacterized protein n=1 Tax=Dreissena polymorpha TaxID=45954 RepID=A0A9D4GE45_DREPO|nr:hypothetical protein DPMN_143740 [Dreissena polymorpha]
MYLINYHTFSGINKVREDEPMTQCENEDCPNRFFHLRCVCLTDDSLPETWFCSAACRQQGDESTHCVCKKKRTDIPMVECCNILCQRVSGFIWTV